MHILHLFLSLQMSHLNAPPQGYSQIWHSFSSRLFSTHARQKGMFASLTSQGVSPQEVQGVRERRLGIFKKKKKKTEKKRKRKRISNGISPLTPLVHFGSDVRMHMWLSFLFARKIKKICTLNSCPRIKYAWNIRK